jgi:hypothetical protein
MDTLTDNPSKGTEKTAELYSWSTNYDLKLGTPFGLFLDLIGYAEEQFGEKLNPRSFVVDYESGYAIGQALIEWSDRPYEIEAFCYALLEEEAGE